MKKLFIFILLFSSTNVLAKTDDPFYTPLLEHNISELCGLDSRIKSTLPIQQIQRNHFRLINTKKCHDEIERVTHSYNTVLTSIGKYDPKISSNYLIIHSKIASLLVKHSH